MKQSVMGRTEKLQKVVICHVTEDSVFCIYVMEFGFLSQTWCSTCISDDPLCSSIFYVLSRTNVQIPLCSSLAADEASELLGWALPSHRLLYPVQAHGGLRLHRVQRFRRRAALRGLGALQQAGSLSHHHVQQRSAPVWQIFFSLLSLQSVTLSLQVGDCCSFRDESYTKYLTWNNKCTRKICGEILALCFHWLTEMNSTSFFGLCSCTGIVPHSSQ